jgi:putative endonuclease
MSAQWSVYMLECWDRTLYTGIAIDVEKRLAAHQAGKGAKYTRGRLPVKFVWVESGLEEGDARRREWDIKQLSRQGKQDLFAK